MAKQEHPVHLRRWCCDPGLLGLMVPWQLESERYPVSGADAAFVEACIICNNMFTPHWHLKYTQYATTVTCRHKNKYAHT